MDWENKHFNQEIVIKAPPDVVAEAARRFTGQSLPEWTITPTPDGFEASGSSAAHHAVAKFRLSPGPDGTKVAVEMLVRRAGGRAFMLVDIGGYYDGQIRKWLWAIWNQVASVQADPGGNMAMTPPHGTMEPNATPGARVVVMDAYGKAWVGVVRQVAPQGVLVAYDDGGERWVPATAAHVVHRRDDLPG